MKNSSIVIAKDHLNKSTREFLESCGGSDNEKRVRLIQEELWIGYGHAAAIIEKIQNLIERPRVLRAHSVLIVSSTDNGKSKIRKRIEERNQRYTTADGKIHFPVVSIQMPPNPDERGFYNAILKGMMQPTYMVGKIDYIRDQVISTMEDLGVRLLMIDEVQHIDRMPYKRQRTILDTIKYMSNELYLPMAAFGTEESINIFTADSQLQNRFKKIVLPGWTLDLNFRRLLASLELMLPLKYASELSNEDIAIHIYSKTNGTIGEITTLIKDSAVIAIRSGEERITQSVIDKLNFQSSKAEPL